MKSLEEVCEILEIIADDYEKPESILKKLSSIEGAPKTLEEINAYLQAVGEALILREFGVERIFPGFSHNYVVEKVKWPLKKIFEKTERKLIFLGKVKENMVGIHPFLTYFYDDLRSGFSCEKGHAYKEIHVTVSNGPKLVGFKGVEVYLPWILLEEPLTFYIAFNEEDFNYLDLKDMVVEENKLIANYKIKDENGCILIQIFKPKEKGLSVVLKLPEIFSEIKKNANELRKLIGSDFDPYIKVKIRREELKRKLEEAGLENEEFYKELTEAEKADELIPPDLPLIKSDRREFKLLLETALIGIEDYVEKMEEKIEDKKKKIIEKMMK